MSRECALYCTGPRVSPESDSGNLQNEGIPLDWAHSLKALPSHLISHPAAADGGGGGGGWCRAELSWSSTSWDRGRNEGSRHEVAEVIDSQVYTINPPWPSVHIGSLLPAAAAASRSLGSSRTLQPEQNDEIAFMMNSLACDPCPCRSAVRPA